MEQYRNPAAILLRKYTDKSKSPQLRDLAGMPPQVLNMLSLHAEEMRKQGKNLTLTSLYSDRSPSQMKYAHKRKHAYDSAADIPREMGDLIGGAIEERMPEHLFINPNPKEKSQRPSEYHEKDSPHYHNQILNESLRNLNQEEMRRDLERYGGTIQYLENELIAEDQEKAELLDAMRANLEKWKDPVSKGLNPWRK
jgi:hypothetical protein